jgi:hypothetical protein
MNNKYVLILALLALIPFASAANIVVYSPATVGSSFDVIIGFNETFAGFNGAEFEVDGAEVIGVSTQLVNTEADHYQDRVIVSTSRPTAVKSFAKVTLSVSGSAGDDVIIDITNIKISYNDELGIAKLPLALGSKSLQVRLSTCVDYEFASTDSSGAKLFNLMCYCQEGYVPTVSSLGTPECTSEDYAQNIYGDHSVSCEDGLDAIGDTGFCCEAGYDFALSNNLAEFLGTPSDACDVTQNKNPIAKIDDPDDNDDFDEDERVYFEAKASDSDGEVVAYLWDFGDRSQPWGYLDVNTKDEIICKPYSSSDKSCLEENAVSLYDYDEDEEVPCSCELKYEDELLNIYPKSVSTKQKTFHTYKDKYACTPFDDDQTNECDITLWVFDDRNATGKTSIDIELTKNEFDGGSSLFCGDGIRNGVEECDTTVVNSCATGICEDDCTCMPKATTPTTITAEDIVLDTGNDPVCGNSRCEFGETSATCLSDCHCGDGTCQKTLESGDTCPSDCGSGSSTMIILIVILAASGILFMLYKKGFDFGAFLPAKFSFGKSSSKFSDTPTSAPKSDTGSIEDYIRRTRKMGYSYTQIRTNLEKKGWSEDKINKVFSKVGLQ